MTCRLFQHHWVQCRSSKYSILGKFFTKLVKFSRSFSITGITVHSGVSWAAYVSYYSAELLIETVLTHLSVVQFVCCLSSVDRCCCCDSPPAFLFSSETIEEEWVREIRSRLQPLCWTNCRRVQTSTCRGLLSTFFRWQSNQPAVRSTTKSGLHQNQI